MALSLATLRNARDAIRYGVFDAHGIEFEKFMVAHGDAGNLCDDFDHNGFPTPEGIAKAERFIARARNWTPVGWWLYNMWRAALAVRDVVHCDIAGHRWVDESYGGPDNGCMAGHCTRCGFSFHHILY